MADIKDDISLIGFVLSSPVSLALSLVFEASGVQAPIGVGKQYIQAQTKT